MSLADGLLRLRLTLRTALRRLRTGDRRRERATADLPRVGLRRLFLATGFFLRRFAAIILRVAAFCAALLRFFLATVFFLRDLRRLRGFTNNISGIINPQSLVP